MPDEKTHSHLDSLLGLNAQIDRRDFLNSSALAAGGMLMSFFSKGLEKKIPQSVSYWQGDRMDDDKFSDPPTGQPEPESGSERRAFFKEFDALGAGAFLAGVPMTAQQSAPGAPILQPPATVSNYQKTEKILPNGMETVISYDSMGSNQVTTVNKSCLRRVDGDASYTVFHDCTVSWYEPGINIRNNAMGLNPDFSYFGRQRRDCWK